MTAGQRARVARYERRIEEALRPGTFIAYGAAFEFVRALEAIEDEVATLVAADPGEAVALYEAFLAGCYEKANEVDDSSGNFGQFAQELFRGWVRARQAAGADPNDTAARLVGRMEDDPFGYCYGLEREVSKVMDEPGLAAFVRAVRARFDAAPAPGSPPGRGHDPDRSRRRWAAVLRVLLRQLRDVQAYLALADETETTAADCDAIAKILLEKGDAAVVGARPREAEA